MTGLQSLLQRANPAVSRSWRLALAGIMWTGVGAMLCWYAVTWLIHPLSIIAIALGLLGVAISIAATRMQFSSLAVKNINRILASPDKACVFSFLAWKGYVIIAVMMTGGFLLRSSAIPRPYLAVIYSAIGGALIQGSTNYYARLVTDLVHP